MDKEARERTREELIDMIANRLHINREPEMGRKFWSDLSPREQNTFRSDARVALDAVEARIETLNERIAELYQVIGALSDHAGLFDDPNIIRALDVASYGKATDGIELLPWPHMPLPTHDVGELQAANARLQAMVSELEAAKERLWRQVQELEPLRDFLHVLGFPWLPCPICSGTEGCDHIVAERAREALSNARITELEAKAPAQVVCKTCNGEGYIWSGDPSEAEMEDCPVCSSTKSQASAPLTDAEVDEAMVRFNEAFGCYFLGRYSADRKAMRAALEGKKQ